jgi:hypothetical protein
VVAPVFTAAYVTQEGNGFEEGKKEGNGFGEGKREIR